ncbi:hypothetical protein ACD591_14470 [Rufibacter glacialis]|uniref:Lipoprotein n=1 Tax=Rufibacter glacialis TaxID=1259555 RepID=A0A5M8QTN6_9BACT|nr:hypothetical protein [Rufibacter glacialis]KAA6437833.1 hypothetical protein FOE74_04855 [Rufibacter glacialis]GGK55966.1 hypothetical protein GCM10011405_00040 [Rufibacter glacialis]
MKRYLTFFLLVIGLSACDKATQEKKVVYHVIKKPIVDSTGSTPPPPPTLFYGHHNFIVSSNGKTYYYYHNMHIWPCGNGIDFSRPEFLKLRPTDLVVLIDETVGNFANNIIQDTSSIGKKVFVSISSPSDSIYNNQFEIIHNIIEQKKLRYYTIRKTTEEELAVLDAKINNKEYNSDSVDWKEGFGGIQFFPPKEKITKH